MRCPCNGCMHLQVIEHRHRFNTESKCYCLPKHHGYFEPKNCKCEYRKTLSEVVIKDPKYNG